MAVLPITIPVTTTWLDITTSVALLELIQEETVEIFHNGGGNIEVIIDTIGDAVIDSTFNNKGRIIEGSQFLHFPYTNTTKFYVRRIKYTAKEDSQIQIRKPVKNINVGGADTLNGALRVIGGYGDLSQDAWGHQKVIQDTSLFNSLFTFNVSRESWVPFQDGIELYNDVDVTRISSVNGKLNISSGAVLGNDSYLMSRRHPRYQPNRGHLYSSSIFLPNKNAIGVRNFGLLNNLNGAFFRLEDGILYAVIRTTINTVTTEPFIQAIDLNTLELGTIDLEKGNIFDVQMQWRGVGNVRWFIGNAENSYSVLVAEYNHINIDTELSIFNPSLPVWYESVNTDGTEVIIESGCVDVSTENGVKGNRSYGSTTTGELAISALEVPIISIRIPNMIFGLMNTRDIVLTSINAYADTSSLIRVYYFRDPSLITATFSPIRDGFQEESVNGAITAFNTAGMIKIFETRIPALSSQEFTNPDAGSGDLYLTHGDYVFITIEGKNNSLGGVSVEWAAEV